VTTLVVRRDRHIHVLGRAVGVAERDDGDVDVGSLLDGLRVGARVRDNDNAGFLEGARNVVGEVTGREATGDGGGASVGGKFEDGALAVGAGGDDGDVGGVVDGDEDAGCEDDLLPVNAVLVWLGGGWVWCGVGVPSLADVDHVDAVGPGLPQVWLHVHLQVLAADVALRGQQHLNVLRRGVEGRGELLCGGHLRGCCRCWCEGGE